MKKILFFILFYFVFVNVIFANNSSDKKEKNNINYYQFFKSIMFSPENIQDISATFPRFNYLSTMKKEGEIVEEKNIDELNDIEKKVIKKNLLTFSDANIYVYLNSIMYISKDSWAIWLNENKITNLDNGEKDINILEITPSYVKLEWTFDSNQWEIINPNRNIPDSMYKIENNMVTLFLTLSPNQSFVPSKNKVVEGRPVMFRSIQIQDSNIKKQQQQNKKTDEDSFENLFF